MPETSVNSDAASVGQPVGESVVVELDYAIIRHFSEHLYGSPNKAIEELVSNSYDALARRCDVYIPGSFVRDKVVVWDSGLGMNVDQLKALWVIARSPKGATTERIASDGDIERYMIGKFGIGKLASYSLGERITHYCHVDGEYLAVTVDYREVHAELSDSEEDGGDSHRYSSPIRTLTEPEARMHLKSLFHNPPNNFDELFEQDHWTMAVIDELKDNDLSAGRLMWVLGHAMPLRPDFRLFVNVDEVSPRLAEGSSSVWTLADQNLKDSVSASWSEASRETESRWQVSGDIEFSEFEKEDSATGTVTAVRMPNLGEVTVEVRLFPRSLANTGDRDRPRSYGFFLMVRGRLVNAEDDRLFLPDPSFSTFYRAQFVIHADGLDSELLADRERIRVETPSVRELRALQIGLYRAARAGLEQQDIAAADSLTSQSLLPVDNRGLFREPLTALLLRDDASSAAFEISRPSISRSDLTADAQLSDLDPEGSGFRVNTSHPFFKAIAAKAGSGKKGAEFLRLFDVFAVSERLLEGFLFDQGIEPSKVVEIISWRDQLFRALAARYANAGSDATIEVHESSFKGKKAFEEALARLFRLMGFSAERDGLSGQKDILVVAPIGPDARRITLEAKGSIHPVQNDSTDIDIAAAHRTAVGASDSIIVAREFAGFASGLEDPMVMKQLREVGGVSIVTVDTLELLFNAVQEFSYPLDLIVDILTTVETPASKYERVANLADPLEAFDSRKLLDAIWAAQQNDAEGDLVPARGIWQAHFRDSLTYDAFKLKLAAIESLAGGLLNFKAEQNDVHIRQAPEFVAARIELGLRSSQEVASGVEG